MTNISQHVDAIIDCRTLHTVLGLYFQDPHTSPIVEMVLIHNNGENLKTVLEPSKHLCIEAIKQTVSALLFIPKGYRTEGIYKMALSISPHAIQYVPVNMVKKIAMLK